MSKFNWWRRHKTFKPLTKKQAKPGESFLVQKIKHGDFSISPYWEQMQYELQLGQQYEDEIRMSILGTEAKEDKIRTSWAKQMKRYNKLSEDFLKDEHLRLSSLRTMFLEEFGQDNDYWEKSLSLCDGDVIDLYKIYSQLAHGKNI